MLSVLAWLIAGLPVLDSICSQDTSDINKIMLGYEQFCGDICVEHKMWVSLLKHLPSHRLNVSNISKDSQIATMLGFILRCISGFKKWCYVTLALQWSGVCI